MAVIRAHAPVDLTHTHEKGLTMWTLMDSPVGELRIVAKDGAITAIDFLGGFDDQAMKQSSTEHAVARSGRPMGDRDDDAPLLKEAVRQLGRTSTAT
jgi:methylated-DNA-[protein]-cysteine S-methyltransferase